MDLKHIRDAFDRVTKKQKLSSSKTEEMTDQICQEVENALTKIQSSMDTDSGAEIKSIFSELNAKLMEIGPVSQQEGTQKELSIALSKYQKFLEKSLYPDISKAYRNVNFDAHIVNQIIASHFYREGLFDIGESFIAESNEPEAAVIKSQFLELHHILSSIKNRNLEPALTWASTNHDKLKENDSDLLLKLHRLQFLEIFQNGSGTHNDALDYAKKHLASYSTTRMPEIKKLIGCVFWVQEHDSPYTDFFSPTHWDTLAKEVTQQFHKATGLTYKNPLSVTLAAGAQALPQLLKLMNVVVGKKQNDWQSIKHLPVPLELDKEFQFHSIFVCPVSKDQASIDNPPMLMSCGHVLCRQSITKMSKNNTKSFKCPYCPVSVDSKLCKQLYF